MQITEHEKVCLDCEEVLPDMDIHASNLKKAWAAYEEVAGPQKRRYLGIIKEET